MDPLSKPEPNGLMALFLAELICGQPTHTNPPMNLTDLKKSTALYAVRSALGAALLGGASLFAQQATETANTEDSEETIVLNPFVIEADTETGWVATQSLAGSRLNTDLKDIAAPIEVLTKDFMDEFALNSISDATIYTTNVEGVGDNLESATGIGTGTGFPPPTRIRGLGNATLSRDFFQTRMSSDNYNLDRVTIASGPNNLLFGTGSPAGTIDTSLKRAMFRDFAKVDLQFDSNDSQRYALDVNQELIDGKLAGRLSLLHEEKEYYLKPAGTDQQRIYGTLQFRPWKKTSISVAYEDSNLSNIRPQLLLPWDQVSPWFEAASSGFTGPGMNQNQPAYANPAVGGSWSNGTINNTIFGRNSENPVYVVGNAGSVGGSTYNYRNTAEVRSPRFYPSVNSLNNESDGYTLLDDTYYPTNVNLSGLERLQEVDADTANIFFTQQIGENFFIEAAAQEENYEHWTGGFGGYVSGNALKVDPNAYLTDGTTPNPNFGKYYVQGDVFRENTQYKSSDWRVALSYEKDFTQDGGSWWRQLLGKQRLGGLISHNEVEEKKAEYNARILPSGGLSGNEAVIDGLTLRAPTNNNWATHATRTINVRYYLSATDLTPRAPHYDNINGPFTFVDSNGTAQVIDMLNTGLVDEYGRRLGSNRNNTLLKSKLDTMQLAYQGFFWDDRLAVTMGWRNDKANGANPANQANAAQKAQNGVSTGLRPVIDDVTFEPFDPTNEASGDTTTTGFVLRPFSGWLEMPFGADLTFAYNKSDTFQPDVSNRDPYGFRVKGAAGDGEDKSVRLGLFDGKFSLRYTDFENNAGPARAGNVPYNRFRFTAAGPITRINDLAFGNGAHALDSQYPDMWPALGNGDPYWVTSYQASSGTEWGLDWQVTDNFTVRFNMNRQVVVESDIGIDWWAFLDNYLPQWQALSFPEGGVDNPRDIDGDGNVGTWTWDTAWRADNNDQTVADWWQSAAINGSTGRNIIEGLDGKSNDFIRTDRYNVNWVYRFREGRLAGFSVGGAFRHRAAPLLAYGKKSVPSGDAFDLENPFYGVDENYVDLSFNYRGKTELFGFESYRIGLNIRNVLDENDIYARLVNVNQDVIRAQRVSEPRTFILSLSFDM